MRTRRAGAPFSKNMVLAIEPGIYWPGGGGLRLEDNFLITERGNEKLCTYPDDFRLAASGALSGTTGPHLAWQAKAAFDSRVGGQDPAEVDGRRNRRHGVRRRSTFPAPPARNCNGRVHAAPPSSSSDWKVTWQEVEEGRANVVGRWRGAGGGKNLMFNGHMDTSNTGARGVSDRRWDTSRTPS